MHLSKPVQVLTTAAFMAVSSPSSAADISISLTNSQDTRQIESDSKEKIDFVESHVVLALDYSGSINFEEHKAFMSGVVQALENIKDDCNEGYAFTIVRYGKTSRFSKTYVVYNREDMDNFIASEFDISDKKFEIQKKFVGGQTNISEGLRLVENVLVKQNTLSIASKYRTAIFIGDGPANYGEHELSADIYRLASQHGISVHGIPIMDYDDTNDHSLTRNFFASQLVTPPLIKYRRPEIFGDTNISVIPGILEPAEGFEKVAKSAEIVFRTALN